MMQTEIVDLSLSAGQYSNLSNVDSSQHMLTKRRSTERVHVVKETVIKAQQLDKEN